MPKSQFVDSARIFPLLGYLAFAFVLLLVANFIVGAMGGPRQMRTALVMGWVVLLPVGGWMIWKRSA